MISDKTALYNLALNAVGARSNIASPTENSREAQVCELWYSVVRDAVLAASPWPELTKLASLTLLDERDMEEDWVATNARPGYTFVYELPSDLVRPQYLTNFDRFLLTSYTDDARVLATNTEDAILAYTAGDVAFSAWSSTLSMAMVYGLAAHITLPLTGKASRSKLLADQANNLLWQARETAANSSNETFDHVPDWIAARGYADATVNAGYVYPMGQLLTVVTGV